VQILLTHHSKIHEYFPFLCTDKPGSVTLNVNISGDKVCPGDVLKFTCTANANPAVDTLYAV